MWYRFEEGNPIGSPRVKRYHVAFYDMTNDEGCFDESFFKPDEVARAMPYVETIEDEGKDDRTRVFVHFDDDDMYIYMTGLNDAIDIIDKYKAENEPQESEE